MHYNLPYIFPKAFTEAFPINRRLLILSLFVILNVLFGNSVFAQSTNCATATQISLTNGTACVNGTTLGSVTDNTMYGNCNTVPVNMVWYTYGASGSNNSFTIDPSTLTNAEIVIYTGGCPNSGGDQLENCEVETGGNTLNTQWGMVSGQQVWLGIASNAGTDGAFQLCVNSQPPAPGPGNTCSQAIPICTTSFTQATMPNNSSGIKPSCFGSAPQKDIFVQFTITKSGLLAWKAAATSTEFDWCLWNITSGCPGTETCCNYNYASGSTNGFGMQTQAGTAACGESGLNDATEEFSPPVNVTCGQTYAIQISNYDNTSDGFSITFPGSTCEISSVASFTASPALVCGTSLNAIITDASTGDCAAVWDFGDGTTYTGATPPNHTYTTPGTYAITETIGGACPSNNTEFVQLLAPLVVEIDSAPATCGACDGSASIASITGGDGVYTYSWSNGATTSTISNLCTGTYTLTVNNAACGSTVTKTVTISVPPAPSITVDPPRTCSGISATMTASGASTYSWSPSTGLSATSGSTVTATPSATTTYTVVGSIATCIDTAYATIIVNPKPSVSFTYSQPCEDTASVFTNTSTISSGNNVTYSWDFNNDNNFSDATGANVNHTFGADGVYSVGLVVTSDQGCKDTLVLTNVNVWPDPVAGFNATSVCAQTATGFADNSTVAVGTINTWAWDVNNDALTDATASAAAYTYSTGGTYPVSLSVTSNHGCTDSITKNINVNYIPVPGFSAIDGCLSGAIPFTGTSSVTGALIANSLWDFGDGQTSAQANPSHLYSTCGDKTVTLTVTSDSGCTNNTSGVITVYCLPQAAFTYTQPCEDTATVFTSTSIISAGSNVAFNWDFNNDNNFTDATGSSVSNLFGTGGVYTVALEVISDNGCRDTLVLNAINVWPNPVANFSATSACAQTATNFSDQSAVAAGTITNWAWDVNNDALTDASTPTTTNTYTSGGNYPVSLTATSDHGCKNSITKNINVNYIPVASFSAVGGCLSSEIPFTGTSTVTGAAIVNFLWDFGDGQTSALPDPMHLYATCGDKTVNLSVTSDSGCVNNVTDTITVYCLPQASFTNTQPCEDTVTVFTSTSSISSGNNVTYNWDFNNDNNFTDATGSPVNYLLGGGGTYTVSLEVISDNGCRDTVVITNINVWPNPVADFNATSVCEQAVTNLADNSSVSTGTISAWAWDVNNDAITDASTSTTTNTYTVGGSYPVHLTVTSDHGCVSDTVKNVNVNFIPVPAFTYINACYYDSIVFTNNSTVTSANIQNSQWFFGDGQNSILTNPSHLYGICGDKFVTLVVTSDSGCTNTTTEMVSVFCQPVVSFTYTNACEDSATVFTNTSTINTGNNTAVNWDFNNDNNFSDAAGSPASYLFGAQGTYTVGLEVISDQGCRDTTQITSVNVWPNPVADFNVTSVCAQISSSFNDQSTVSTGAIIGWSWDFDNNGTQDAATPGPSNIYATGGTYPVTLTATTDHGCSHDTTKNINVNYIPVAGFTAINVCVYDSVVFTNNSTIAGGAVASSQWDFSDGQSSTVTSPSHLYANCGNRSVTLTVTSDSGCVNSIVKPIVVYCKPISRFTVTNICEYDTAIVVSTSSVSDGTITVFEWDSDIDNPPGYIAGTDTLRNHYLNGIYNIGLTVTSSNGCADDSIMKIEIYPQPSAGFGFATGVCLGQPTCFYDSSAVNSSSSVNSWNWDFGSGSDITQNPCHQFLQEGSHNVTLIAGTTNNCYDTVYATVFVNPIPVVTFTDTNVCLGTPTTFTNTSPQALANYTWDFGDGSSSAQPDTVHTYAAANNYTVTLIGQSDSGCVNVATGMIYVYPNPVADFSTPDIEGCEPWTSTFINATYVTDPVSSSTINSYVWDFGNGSADQLNSPDPTAIEYAPGSYTVSLTVTTNYSCSDTLTRTNYIVVHPTPKADFSFIPETGATIMNPLITFYDQSTGADHHNWNMGDSTVLNDVYPQGESFVYTYKDSGHYIVTQVVTTDYGCIDSIQKTIVIGPDWAIYIPNAFTPNDDGLNDYFNARGFGIVDYEMYIFDRWGNAIDRITSITEKGWDGIANNGSKVAQIDHYVYKIYFTDAFGGKHQYNGTFSLLR